MSNIRAIGSRNKQPSIVIKNQLLALELGEKLQLSIEWIPAHQAFEGNEVADRLAKATYFSKTICYSLLKYSLEYAKQKVNNVLRNQWDTDWKQSC